MKFSIRNDKIFQIKKRFSLLEPGGAGLHMRLPTSVQCMALAFKNVFYYILNLGRSERLLPDFTAVLSLGSLHKKKVFLKGQCHAIFDPRFFFIK
jgi:hypothetical protein